jgi:AsmA protein
VSLKLSDGALHGINLAEMIREARATLTGKGADQVKEVRKTDFSALTASFQIADGLPGATTSSCLPRPAGEGQGQTALVPETLDFLFLTSVVRAARGRGQDGGRAQGHHHTGAHRRPLAGAELPA